MFSVDNTDPIPGCGRTYTRPVQVNGNVRLKAVAIRDDHRHSPVAGGFYELTPPPPTVRPIEAWAVPAGGKFGQAVDVVLRASHAATLHYTLDGSQPTTNSPVYAGPIPVGTQSTTTLRYFAIDADGNRSSELTARYDVFATLPTVTLVEPATVVTSPSGRRTVAVTFSVDVATTYRVEEGGAFGWPQSGLYRAGGTVQAGEVATVLLGSSAGWSTFHIYTAGAGQGVPHASVRLFGDNEVVPFEPFPRPRKLLRRSRHRTELRERGLRRRRDEVHDRRLVASHRTRRSRRGRQRHLRRLRAAALPPADRPGLPRHREPDTVDPPRPARAAGCTPGVSCERVVNLSWVRTMESGRQLTGTESYTIDVPQL